MSCYSIVKLNLDIKATADEIVDAAKDMGLTVQSKSTTAIICGGVTFSRADANSAWSVTGANQFDSIQFRREVARSKVLAEAKRQGYRITNEERHADKIVLRMKVI